MSAFVVDAGTMTRVVKAILAKPHGSHIIRNFAHTHTDDTNAGREIGRALFAMNIDAVRQRYAHIDGAHAECDAEAADAARFDFNDWRPISNKELIGCYKAMRCLSYQCSEGNVPETDLFKALEEASGVIAEHIVTRLPAYEAAPW